MPSVIRLTALSVLSMGLLACSDVQDRFAGYPTEDTVINLEIATSNEIADALSQMARISVAGDDWEFLNPHDLCTVHVIDRKANQSQRLQLQGAKFSLHRDPKTHRYYALMQHGDKTVMGQGMHPLRLFEAERYYDVFFAEGYLQELGRKCVQSLTIKAASGQHPQS